MAIRRNACSRLALPDLPEFAQAGRYGVPGTPPWCTRNSTHAEGPITISGRSNAEEDTAIALGKQLISIPDMVHESRRYPLGIYRGLNFGLVLHPQGARRRTWKEPPRGTASFRVTQAQRAVLNALDRLTAGYKAQAATARLPAAHEIADRIKTLKAAHSIEPTPQRPATPHTAAAEDPVTARICRRIDLPAAYEPAVEPERPASPAITEPVLLRLDAAVPAPAKPKPTYQDRVTRNNPGKHAR